MGLVISDGMSKKENRTDYIMSVVNVKRSRTLVQEIYPNLAHKFAGDFYGLLLSLNVRRVNFGTVLRLNGLKASDEFDGSKYNIILLDES